jgi:uncharacterized protein (DUF2141 family)
MTSSFRGHAALFVLLLTGTLARGEPPAGRIVFELDQLRSDRGLARCFLFPSAEGFPGGVTKSIARATSAVSHHTAQCTFEGISPGDYAISCYHDENSNDHFDTNFLGFPLEGYAASNDANSTFGPKFKDARFTFLGGERVLRAHFVY